MKRVMVSINLNDGMMTTQQTVWCGWCHHWDTVSGGKRGAAEEFRRSGWSKSGGKWLCPGCTLNGVKLGGKPKSVVEKPFEGSEEARQEMATDKTLLFHTQRGNHE